MKLRTLFSDRPIYWIALILGVALSLLVAGSAQAALVTLSFSGKYNTAGTTVFGLSGSAVPYNFQITYDTTLNTNTFFFPTGASLGGETTTHEWHGYSSSGITATSLTFGSQTWTAGDLSPRIPAVGVTADLWFDTDISLSTPTRSWIFFNGVGFPGFLQLGGGTSNGINIFMEQGSSVTDFQSGNGISSLMTITSSHVSSDSDGDGVLNGVDECPNSDLSTTVVIGGCNSGVTNTLFSSGCKISDLIAACAEGVSNHGQFVSCVSHKTNDLKIAGTITGKQKGAIQSCAAHAKIP